jgi:hypothetical protein
LFDFSIISLSLSLVVDFRILVVTMGIDEQFKPGASLNDTAKLLG